MGRGYVFGLLTGALASVLGLAGVSLMLPPAPAPVPAMVTEPVAADEAAEPAEVAASEETAPEETAPETASETVAAPAPEATEAAMPKPEPEPEPEQQPAPTGADATVSAAAEAPARVPETPEVEVPAGSEFARPKPEEDPVLPAPEPAPAIAMAPGVAQPQAEAAPELAEVNPAAIPEGQSVAPTAPAVPETATAPAVAEAPAADTAVPVPPPGEAIAPVLGSEPAADTASGIVTAEPAPEPVPAPEPIPDAAPDPMSDPMPDAAPAAESLDMEPSEDLPAEDDGPVIIDVAPRAPIGAANAPQPGFGQSVPGVKVNRLPTIGGDTPAADVPGAESRPFAPAPAPEPAPEIVLDTPGLPATGTAVARFGARFDNPETLPLLAVIIEDIGEEKGGVGPDALAALGRPVTIAIDPERPDAAARAVVYRLAGHEVAILAPDLPAGATASDLEVSYQSFVRALPESVALIGAPGASFQTDRRIAQHLVALMATDGRGLISYARGLNPARQAAAGAGVPHADVYRDLDAGGESEATIARYLDRAAFEAARQGEVVVSGTSAAETVGALKDWIAAGAKGTAVGPVSAAMLGE